MFGTSTGAASGPSAGVSAAAPAPAGGGFSFGNAQPSQPPSQPQPPTAPQPSSQTLPTMRSMAPATTTTAASPPAAPPPPQPDFAADFQRATEVGTLTPALISEIKTRFSAPYSVSAPTTDAAKPTGPVAGTGSLGVGMATGNAWGAPATGSTAAAPMAPAGLAASLNTHMGSAGNAAMTSSSRAALQARNLSLFLSVLLNCDSGYMNVYENEVDPTKNTAANKEAITGLHAAVASIAAASASSIVAYLTKELSPDTLGLESISKTLQGVPRSTTGAGGATPFGSTLVGVHADAGHAVHHVGSNPFMAGAQCLYLLTRHFQMQPSFVKESLALVEVLLTHVQTELKGRSLPHLSSFRESHETGALCSLTWLVVLSVGNAMSVWKKIRATSGDAALGQNNLIRSDAATTLGNAITAMRKRFEDAVLASGADRLGKSDEALGFLSRSAGRPLGAGGLLQQSGGLGSGSTSASATAAATALVRSGAARIAVHHRWLAVVNGFLSILTLVEGCVLRAKGNEDGFDRALEAFLGEPDRPLSEAFGGKVAKRIVQFAPAPFTLAIPIDYIYMVPYEMLSYMFDDMLPLVYRVAQLEIDADRNYLEEVLRLEDALPLGLESVALRRHRDGASNSLGDIFFAGRREGYSNANHRHQHHADSTEHGMAAEPLVSATLTTEMANILGCISECLEHLSPDVLDPDLDSDCSVTFFIFRNCVKHMAQVFALQRNGGTALWENFTLILVSKFLDVLSMIGRNPQYVVRVVDMLTTAQEQCPEMQWANLIQQALLCAGFTASDGERGNPMSNAQANAGGSVSYDPAGYATRGAGGPGMPSSSSPSQQQQQQQQQQQLPDQYTVEYARKCQQQYISSFFMFLRQAFAHPLLREIVSQYLSLELALSFTFAPWQSQLMLGSTLSLISALVSTPRDAATVWAFLDTNRLIHPPKFSPWAQSVVTGSGLGFLTPRRTLEGHPIHDKNGDTLNGSEDDSVDRYERLSILGHCLFEATIGEYCITVGYLNLMISLFRYSRPSTASYALFASMAHFIAEDIFVGVSKRSFVNKKERYTVVALAAAALRQALSVRFVAEAGANGEVALGGALGPSSEGIPARRTQGSALVIPFATVMAAMKPPADVTSEALKVLFKASSTPYELASHQRAAARQCVQLLTAAIRAVREQQLEVFAFDSRTIQSASLAYHTLYLCSANDPTLMRAALELLLEFPRPVMAQATEYWSGEVRQLSGVITLLADLLHPNTVAVLGSIVRAPPELAILDADPNDPYVAFHQQVSVNTRGTTTAAANISGGAASAAVASGSNHSEDLARENRSLLLDLLIAHALNAELSVAVWLCGFAGASAGSALGTVTGDSSLQNHLTDTQILDAVVAGVTSTIMERKSPGLAVKYAKLIYLLRSNRLYGPTLMRGFMESACQDLFLGLQRFCADACSPVLLSKYAYVLKLLALEALDVYNTNPEHLDVMHMVVPSIPAEVLLSLLHLNRHGGGDVSGSNNNGQGNGGAPTAGYERLTGYAAGDVDGMSGRDGDVDEALPRALSADMAQWLAQCFRRLSTFPVCNPPIGRDRYLTPAAQDGVVQFDIPALYAAFQLEHYENDLPPLTNEDFRGKLGPFIEANQCFLEYASTVNFVESWCQLMDMSLSVVRGVSARRLRTFFIATLQAMDETRRMTQAAQEQTAYHLFNTLTTVAAQLKSRCLEDPEASLGLSADKGVVGELPQGRLALTDRSLASTQGRMGTALSAASPSGAASRLATSGVRTGAASSGALSGNATRRRRREDGIVDSRSYGTNVFSTRAGEQSNLLSLANRTRLSKSALHSESSSGSGLFGYDNRDIAGDELSLDALMRGQDVSGEMSGAAANQTLLRRLVVTLVQWGGRIPVIRGDAYLALLCLTQIPGASADDFVVFRCKDALFDMITADITGATTHGVPTALSRQRALTLLLQLLQTSPALCGAFCSSADEGAGSMGPRPLRCAKALLRDVDLAVSSFIAGGETGHSAARARPPQELHFPSIASRDFGGVLFFIRSAFDFLGLLSLHRATQVLQGNVISACLVMECWNRCVQVFFGRTAPTAVVSSASPGTGATRTLRQDVDGSAAKLEQNREVLKRLLLGTVRWFNVMHASLGEAPAFVSLMQEFVRLRRPLLEDVLLIPLILQAGVPASPTITATTASATAGANGRSTADGGFPLASAATERRSHAAISRGSPGAALGATSAGGQPVGSLNTVSLTLLTEVTDLLRGLSASALAEECRALVQEIPVPQLLLQVSSEAFAQFCRHHVHGDYFEPQLTESTGATKEPANSGSLVPAGGHVTGQNRREAAGAATAPSTLARRNLDLVALATRNLAHFLLRSEYGLRAYAENPDMADLEAAFPRMRGQQDQVVQVLRVTQQVAYALECDGAAARAGIHAGPVADVSELRMECHLYALHALVCLVHSFLLPLPAGTAEEHIKHYVPYLRSLPLKDMLQLLEYCQSAIYKQTDFNADYRTGIAGVRTSDGGWSVGASSLSNRITNARMQSGRKAVQGRNADGSTMDRRIAEPGTPSLGANGQKDAQPVTPLTPLFHAESGHVLSSGKGNNAGSHSKGGNALTGRVGAPATAQTPDFRAPPPMPHTSLLALNLSRVAPDHGLDASFPAAAEGDATATHGFLSPTADDTATIATNAALEQTTIGQLMKGIDGGDGDTAQEQRGQAWQQFASSSSALPSWEAVLSMESTVRQVKIAIANALRAAAAAITLVERN